ncbi:hypothetical protein, partial [Carbonactinospora thermoautotrophica]|uniref:hypothetical protein n=1 Tax=Carbonactinospora thermoautotrophica TaxID=1469144 RepID=UPI001301417D
VKNQKKTSSRGTVAALALGLLLAVCPAVAAHGTEADPIVGGEDDVLSSEASPYVLADSPAEAGAILAELEDADPPTSMTAASVQYGPCVLYPTTVYLRTSSNKKAVGFKPYTKCSVPVTSIHHESDLRYKWYLWWRKAGTWKGGNWNASSYTQRNIEYFCKGSSSTTWAGTTLGTIVYRGRTYYARVYPTQKKLACKA